MFIRIERGSAVPVSRQMAEQIRAQCLAGALPPGAQLPSVRQLARELAVNQNTVLRVYEKLTAEGLLELRHGEGTFVAHRLPTQRLDGQQSQYREELARIARQGLLLGLSAAELRTLFAAVLKESQTLTRSASLEQTQ